MRTLIKFRSMHNSVAYPSRVSVSSSFQTDSRTPGVLAPEALCITAAPNSLGGREGFGAQIAIISAWTPRNRNPPPFDSNEPLVKKISHTVLRALLGTASPEEARQTALALLIAAIADERSSE
jgi:hypothetical protein